MMAASSSVDGSLQGGCCAAPPDALSVHLDAHLVESDEFRMFHYKGERRVL